MRKQADRVFVLVYVALAVLPLIGLVLGWRGRKIYGALPDAAVAAPSWSAILDETYQHGLVTWFEGNLGFRGTAIALDNTLLYHVFHETKPGAPVRIGRGGMLFSPEDIDYFNTQSFPTAEHSDRVAEKLATVQRLMRARGRAIVPVIIPSGTTVWRDMIPDTWRVGGGEPASDRLIYRAFEDALDRRHVAYVDARDLFVTSDEPRERLWGRDGRHWSPYGACLAMQAVARRYTELTGRTELQGFGCRLRVERERRYADKAYDLWRILNAYGVKLLDDHVSNVEPGPPSQSAHPPSLLFIGTSFGWTLLEVARDSGLIGDTIMDYYNKTFMPFKGDPFPVEPGTPRWRSTMFGQDLYVLDLFEIYLGTDGIEQELDQLLAELAP